MRFTIRQMMAWTIVIAVILGALFGFPDIVSLPLMAVFIMSMPVTLIVGTIYARNWKRTFFIGALIATGPMLAIFMIYGPMMMLGATYTAVYMLDLSDIDEVTQLSKVYAVALAVLAGLNGSIALAVRWLVSDSTRPAQMATPVTESPVVNRFETVPVPYTVMEGRVTVEST